VSDGENKESSDPLAIRSSCQTVMLMTKRGLGALVPIPDASIASFSRSSMKKQTLEGGRFFFSFENVVSFWFRQIVRHKVVYVYTSTQWDLLGLINEIVMFNSGEPV
jgi:hypothetical protein